MDIWIEIKKNNESGAKRLVSEYGDRLFAAAILLCPNDHDAEELVFRTFDQAIRKIKQFQPTSSFFNWLYTIMLNFRRMDVRKRRVELVPLGTTSDLPDSFNPMMAELIARTECDSIRQALRSLAAPLREVAIMHYFIGSSVGEIATALSIPEGTVKSRLHQARANLYAILSAKIKEVK